MGNFFGYLHFVHPGDGLYFFILVTRNAVFLVAFQLLALSAFFLLSGYAYAVLDEFFPEGTEALEEFLGVGTGGLVDLAVVALLEAAEEEEELVEVEVAVEFVVEDELGGMDYLALGDGVGDADEVEGLGDVVAEQQEGGFSGVGG